MLELVKNELEEQDDWVVKEYCKFGAAAALAICGSLRGPEVFLLDIAGLWMYIGMGRSRIVPPNPLKTRTNLSKAPYVIATLIGEFKGELKARHHLLALADVTTLGIELQWWLEKLMIIREREGCRAGPAFGQEDGSVGLMSEYDEMLHYSLRILQKECPDMISPLDDIEANYSFSRTFRLTMEGIARVAKLDSGDQNDMNRWKKIEAAKGKRPRFNMADHYSHAKQLMPVTWQYSFVQ